MVCFLFENMIKIQNSVYSRYSRLKKSTRVFLVVSLRRPPSHKLCLLATSLPEAAPAEGCPAPDSDLLDRGVHDQAGVPRHPLLIVHPAAAAPARGQGGQEAPLHHHLRDLRPVEKYRYKV